MSVLIARDRQARPDRDHVRSHAEPAGRHGAAGGPPLLLEGAGLPRWRLLALVGGPLRRRRAHGRRSERRRLRRRDRGLGPRRRQRRPRLHLLRRHHALARGARPGAAGRARRRRVRLRADAGGRRERRRLPGPDSGREPGLESAARTRQGLHLLRRTGDGLDPRPRSDRRERRGPVRLARRGRGRRERRRPRRRDRRRDRMGLTHRPRLSLLRRAADGRRSRPGAHRRGPGRRVRARRARGRRER